MTLPCQYIQVFYIHALDIFLSFDRVNSTSTSTVFDSLRAMANPGRSQQEDSTTRSRHQQDTTRRPDSMISFLNHLRNSRADIDSNTRTIERARGLVEPRAIAEMERYNQPVK